MKKEVGGIQDGIKERWWLLYEIMLSLQYW